MQTEQAISSVIGQFAFPALSVILLAIIQWVIALWLKSRLELSIQHEYDKKLSEFQFELKTREQAAKIAEFFSEWVKGMLADQNKLRQFSMELSLWLPDETYKKFGQCVTYAPNAPNQNEVLIEIRKHLLKDSAGDLKSSDIVLFF